MTLVYLCEHCHREKASETVPVGTCTYQLGHNCAVKYRAGFFGLVDKNKQEKEFVVDFKPDFA